MTQSEKLQEGRWQQAILRIKMTANNARLAYLKPLSWSDSNLRLKWLKYGLMPIVILYCSCEHHNEVTYGAIKIFMFHGLKIDTNKVVIMSISPLTKYQYFNYSK